MTVIGILERPRERQMGPVSIALLAIDRLIETVREETLSLHPGGNGDLERTTHLKNVGFLELTRAMRALGSRPHDFDLSSRLGDLRQELCENARVLSIHLAAANEIADLVSGAIEDAASDGTYTANHVRMAAR